MNALSGSPFIHLEFPGFAGSALELTQAVKNGRLSAAELPVLLLVEQAMAQVESRALLERSELLPILAELLLFKLRSFTRHPKPTPEEIWEEAEAQAGFLETLVALEEAVAFLERRARERERVLPVSPPPLPKDRRLRKLPLERLLEAARPFVRRVELALEQETFGLREAWERIGSFLRQVRRSVFRQLPLTTWAEQTVGFAALLEAKRQGEVELYQERNFSELEISLSKTQKRTALGGFLPPGS
ncbi:MULTISPECIES: chromosome segregation protein ScpA [unclassified Meiothermus]|uniref:chromosome segregation protein ScpA n=1 Tax=unclassified Meiothermus TaxID=370471 RepID=UPI000D7CB915|nr:MULTISPECIES: chromosome segregation protein ScpA [unclassified Meiothermus]PZA06483.1 chromosome segregation protein ScpA [Meiothermus sp. Pnk-1]RYM36250.1 chromosome segregation protein ScpA [Meiothermus sp. PNK-Is4]